MGTAMSDLETLIPQAVELVIDGEPLAIKPLKVGQMPAFLRAITPVMQQIGGDGIDWLALFGERGDDLLTAMSIAIGKPRAWVDELAADGPISTLVTDLLADHGGGCHQLIEFADAQVVGVGGHCGVSGSSVMGAPAEGGMKKAASASKTLAAFIIPLFHPGSGSSQQVLRPWPAPSAPVLHT